MGSPVVTNLRAANLKTLIATSKPPVSTVKKQIAGASGGGGSGSSSKPSPAATQALSPSIPPSRPRGWSNVLNVFAAPWRGQGIEVMGKNIPVVSPLLSGITGAAEIGAGIYTGGKILGAAGAIGGGSAAAGGGFSQLLNKGTLVGAGAGLLAGTMIGSASENRAPIMQYPQQNTTTTTSTTSNVWNVQKNIQSTNNTILNSPGATIGGSPQLFAEQTPSVTTSPSVGVSPGQSLEATSSSNSWLIPALIVGAIMLLKR
jgi:hypothetical protein